MANEDTDFREHGRRLSPVLSKIILQSEEDNRQILTPKDFADFYRCSESYARKMITELVDNGWLLRVGAGEYQLLSAKTGLEPYPSADKFVLAGQLSPDGFISFGSAAEYHGLTTQLFQTVTIATLKRARVREAPPVRIEYIHIKQENFVGFLKSTKAPDVMVATIDRTLIDAIHQPELCGGLSDLLEIYQRGHSRANVDKILEFLPTYGSKSLVQRVAYMLELAGIHFSSDQEKELQTMSSGNFAYLFSRHKFGANSTVSYDKKWRLTVNAAGFGRKKEDIE